MTIGDAEALAPFVPRIAAEWHLDAGDSRWQQVEGTLCMVDLSGFTALSESLAQRGRIGAGVLIHTTRSG